MLSASLVLLLFVACVVPFLALWRLRRARVATLRIAPRSAWPAGPIPLARRTYHRVRVLLGRGRGTDTIRGSVGEGATDVAIGKNIIQVGTLVTPLLPALVALLVVALALVGLLLFQVPLLWGTARPTPVPVATSVSTTPTPPPPPPAPLPSNGALPDVAAVLLVLVLLGGGVLLAGRSRGEPRGRPEPEGSLQVPARMYEGDSKVVIVRLAGWGRLLRSDGSSPFPLSLIDASGNTRPLGIQAAPGLRPKYLELEMLAAGFTVVGDMKQRNEVDSPQLIYRWNISPERSGKFEIGLAFRGEDGSGRIWEYGVITHVVTVFKLLNLTNRQLVTITSGFGVFSGVFAIIQAASRLGFVRLAP